MASLRGTDLLVATGNAGKLKEFSVLLAPFGTKIHSLTDLGLLQDQGAHLSLIMKNGDLVKDTLSGAAQPAATSRAQVPRS